MPALKICLKTGEKIYINGAVLEASHKMSFNILNNATFLLESHIIQAENANTPFRQLYFIIQTMLIQPDNKESILQIFHDHCEELKKHVENKTLSEGLDQVISQVERDRAFEALKSVRNMFEVEATVLNGGRSQAA